MDSQRKEDTWNGDGEDLQRRKRNNEEIITQNRCTEGSRRNYTSIQR